MPPGWNEHPTGGVPGPPASDPTPDPDLVQMFRKMREDARQPQPIETPTEFDIAFTFDGADQQPVEGDMLTFPVGRMIGRLMVAHLVANLAGTCEIELVIGTMSSWPVSSPLYGALRPALSGTATRELDISDWKLSLQPNDILAATLNAVAAPITSLTLTLTYLRLAWPSVQETIVDGSGNRLVTQSGATLIRRH